MNKIAINSDQIMLTYAARDHYLAFNNEQSNIVQYKPMKSINQ